MIALHCILYDKSDFGKDASPNIYVTICTQRTLRSDLVGQWHQNRPRFITIVWISSVNPQPEFMEYHFIHKTNTYYFTEEKTNPYYFVGKKYEYMLFHFVSGTSKIIIMLKQYLLTTFSGWELMLPHNVPHVAYNFGEYFDFRITYRRLENVLIPITIFVGIWLSLFSSFDFLHANCCMFLFCLKKLSSVHLVSIIDFCCGFSHHYYRIVNMYCSSDSHILCTYLYIIICFGATDIFEFEQQIFP